MAPLADAGCRRNRRYDMFGRSHMSAFSSPSRATISSPSTPQILPLGSGQMGESSVKTPSPRAKSTCTPPHHRKNMKMNKPTLMKNSPKANAYTKYKFTVAHESRRKPLRMESLTVDKLSLQRRAWSQERHTILRQTQQPILVRKTSLGRELEIVYGSEFQLKRSRP